MRPFRNEPLAELRRPAERAALLGALPALDAHLPLPVPVLLGDGHGADEGIDSTDPGRPDRLVARAGVATAGDVDHAVGRAALGHRPWSALPAERRAEALVAAAAELRGARADLAALQVRECGKPWPEADADVCEAIDHLEYAARLALALDAGRELAQVPGERNTLRYRARGVVAAISPWNFPLAIPAGLVAGPLAAGNAVILKPAEQAPASGRMLVEALRGGGVPPDAIQLLPGAGETGAALVAHPGVQTIAFTGSEAVGLAIVRAAAETPPGQSHVKRVVAEMGGKNAVIVDADADLDEVVPELVRSAFSFAGQKCSAAARLLVHEAVHDALRERLRGAVATLRVGPAEDLATDVGPVIDREAQARILDAMVQAAATGEVVARVQSVPSPGWFCAPVVAGGLPPDSPLLREELFGPFLTIEPVAGVDEALDLVEADRHALTGGLFTRDPRTVERVLARSPVGNLYVNRAITGAVVGRQPFGGARRSGTGAKVGGPDSLLPFVDAQVVTERTMRHGLVIEPDGAAPSPPSPQ